MHFVNVFAVKAHYLTCLSASQKRPATSDITKWFPKRKSCIPHTVTSQDATSSAIATPNTPEPSTIDTEATGSVVTTSPREIIVVQDDDNE